MWIKRQEPQASSPSHEPKALPATAPPMSSLPPASAPSGGPPTLPGKHLPSTLVIRGEITGRGDLCIDGEVSGEIHLEDGIVTIGPEGRVKADIHAREIVVRGHVHGNLIGRERVQIGSSGHATGNVLTRVISIEDGAELHGEVEVTRTEERLSRRLVPVSSDQTPGGAFPARTKQSAIGA